METGIPFRGSDKSNWINGVNTPTFQSYGAHDLAPKFTEIKGGRFGHWKSKMGKEIPRELILKDDLSNLDKIVRNYKKNRKS